MRYRIAVCLESSKMLNNEVLSQFRMQLAVRKLTRLWNTAKVVSIREQSVPAAVREESGVCHRQTLMK